MATCIICHLGIIKGVDSSQDCPNGHLAHTDCLKEWLVHSSNCPLCREPYPDQVINKFKGYIDQKGLTLEILEPLKSDLQKIRGIASVTLSILKI